MHHVPHPNEWRHLSTAMTQQGVMCLNRRMHRDVLCYTWLNVCHVQHSVAVCDMTHIWINRHVHRHVLCYTWLSVWPAQHSVAVCACLVYVSYVSTDACTAMCHTTHINESFVTHMNASCLTHKCIITHTCMRHMPFPQPWRSIEPLSEMC